MNINKHVLNVVSIISRHFFLVASLLMFAGCASVTNLFSNDDKTDSESTVQTSSDLIEKENSSDSGPDTQYSSDLFSNDKKMFSQSATQSSSEDITTDSEQDTQSDSNDKSNKKDEVSEKDEESESEEVASVSPLWENSVGDDVSLTEDFSARDAVDDLISLSYPIGTSVTGTTAMVPGFHNDAIYAASSGGQLTRFDPVTGNEVWSVDTKHRLSGGVGVSEEIV